MSFLTDLHHRKHATNEFARVGGVGWVLFRSWVMLPCVHIGLNWLCVEYLTWPYDEYKWKEKARIIIIALLLILTRYT